MKAIVSIILIYILFKSFKALLKQITPFYLVILILLITLLTLLWVEEIARRVGVTIDLFIEKPTEDLFLLVLIATFIYMQISSRIKSSAIQANTQVTLLVRKIALLNDRVGRQK